MEQPSEAKKPKSEFSLIHYAQFLCEHLRLVLRNLIWQMMCLGVAGCWPICSTRSCWLANWCESVVVYIELIWGLIKAVWLSTIIMHLKFEIINSGNWPKLVRLDQGCMIWANGVGSIWYSPTTMQPFAMIWVDLVIKGTGMNKANWWCWKHEEWFKEDAFFYC